MFYERVVLGQGLLSVCDIVEFAAVILGEPVFFAKNKPALALEAEEAGLLSAGPAMTLVQLVNILAWRSSTLPSFSR